MPVLPQQRFGKLSHNPFLARDRPDVGTDKAVPPPVNAPSHGKLPPLPPRKPSLLAAPPRHPSEAVLTPITSTTNLMTPSGPPLVPMKPTHVMSPLMRQSLEASKHAQSKKRAEEQLDRERVLQVLKTSSSSSSVSNAAPSLRTRSLSPSKQPPQPPNGHRLGPGSGSGSGGSDDATYVPPLPRRRQPSLPSSTSSSVLSLDQVAGAKLPSPAPTPTSRPPLPSRDVHALGVSTDGYGVPAVAGPGPIPPPTHPYRRPSSSTEPTVNDSQPSSPSSPRVARSKSVTASSSVPPPPPRRRRPESMQLTPTSDMDDLPTFPPVYARTHGRTTSYQGLSRHLSLTRDRERDHSDSSPIANIQRTLANFQLKAQPKLDAVRYKAEAGFSRRGYVHHSQLGGARWREEGEQGLMTDTRWGAANVNQAPDSAPTTDDEPSSSEDQGARRAALTATSITPYRDFLTESDNLKWPMGEGWKPL